jgi:hypothetical protein
MSKRGKPGQGRRGWPRRSKATGKDAKTELIERLSRKLEAGTVPKEKVTAFLHRLVELIERRPALAVVLPDFDTVDRALNHLPEREREALLGASQSKRRAARGRARLATALFTPDFLEDFAAALGGALDEAEDEQDIGALLCALHSLEHTRQGLLQPTRDPLLGVLVAVVLLERAEAARELSQAGCFDESNESSAVDQDDAGRFHEALASCPHVRRDAERRIYHSINRLVYLMRDRVIHARLTDEELSPLLDRLDAVLASRNDELEEAIAALADSAEAGRLFEEFADDPTNAPAFQRFTADLEAEARRAVDAGHPRAEEISRAAGFWRSAHEVLDVLRVCVVKTSLLRWGMQDDTDLAGDDVAPS